MASRSKKEKRLLFSSPRSRVFASTLGVLVVSLLMTAAMPLYLPFSQADSLGIPIIGFPITWLGLFLAVLFIEKIWRVWMLLATLSAIHSVLIYMALAG